MRFNPILEQLNIYEAGKPIELVVRDYGLLPSDIVKLASNENPHGTSPRVTAAVRDAAAQMYRYPDDSFYELKEALAARFGVSTGNLVIGSGSDQVLEFATRAVLSPGSIVLMNGITFAMYEIYARQCGATIVKTSSRRHDLEEFVRLYREHRPRMIFLCVPNNPTGDALDKEEIYSFLDTIDPDTCVIVDGAYMEYAAFKDPAKAIDPADLIGRYANTIYLGTFSKAYGLGGMRVGYGIAPAVTIQALTKLRPPFNITTLSLLAAVEALKDPEFVRFSIADCFEQMSRYETFAAENGLEYIESYTNFITLLLPPPIGSRQIAQALLEKGVIVRDMTGYGMNAIRVTIGTAGQNDRFFEIFKLML